MTPPPPSAAALIELEALRATIRERGSVRVVLAWLTIAVWAVLATALTVAATYTGTVNTPLFTLLPLLVLVVGFQAVLAIHIGVERIGRYIQVFHEEAADWHGWEHVAMTIGQQHPGGPDPLFLWPFAMAALLNLLPVLLVGVAIEVGAIGAAHAFFLAYAAYARHAAGRQRATDLDRFRALYRANSAETGH